MKPGTPCAICSEEFEHELMTIYITHSFPHHFFYICDPCETRIRKVEEEGKAKEAGEAREAEAE